MLPDRAVIRLSGEGVRDFLQGLVTNDVEGELPVYAGLLTPQGKALYDFIVWEDPRSSSGQADLLIDCEAEQADALVRRLSLYRLRRPIAITRDEALAVHWSRASDAGVADPRDRALGRRWIGSPSEPAQDWHAHRLSLGIVEGAAELGQDKTLWLETNAREQNGVSFTKGCYVGQENTARMHHRGKVNRALSVIAIGDAEPDSVRAAYPDLGQAVVFTRKNG